MYNITLCCYNKHVIPVFILFQVLLMAIIGTIFAQSNTYLPPKQNGYDYPAPPGKPVSI